jgi:hypothetical protein
MSVIAPDSSRSGLLRIGDSEFRPNHFDGVDSIVEQCETLGGSGNGSLVLGLHAVWVHACRPKYQNKIEVSKQDASGDVDMNGNKIDNGTNGKQNESVVMSMARAICCESKEKTEGNGNEFGFVDELEINLCIGKRARRVRYRSYSE